MSVKNPFLVGGYEYCSIPVRVYRQLSVQRWLVGNISTSNQSTTIPHGGVTVRMTTGDGGGGGGHTWVHMESMGFGPRSHHHTLVKEVG